MAFSTKVNGLVTLEMAKANKNGLMELYMRVSGKTIKLKEKENLPIQMVTTMMEIGQMTKPMGMESTFITKLEQSMKVIGKMICNMAQEWKSIAMAINIKACSNKEKEMVRVLTTMQRDKFIKEAGSMEELKGLESVNGQMESIILGNGKTIKNMVKGFTHGQMAENMKETTEMIKNMVKELTLGLTKGNILGNGKMTKGMVEVCM